MGDKHRIKLILNYRKRVGKNCRSTDRIFLGKPSTAPGKDKRPSERWVGNTIEETDHKVALNAVRKYMKRILKETG